MKPISTIELLISRTYTSLRRLVMIASVGLLAACGGGDVGDDQRKLPLAVTTQAAPVYERDDLYRFFAVAFGAAPGITYMDQLLDAANAGMSIKAIVNVFTTKPQFKETYPDSLSNQEYAQKLVDNVVGTSASAAAKAEAVADIVAALSLPNWTRGDITYIIFNNLANKSVEDIQWGPTAAKMANQVIYAKYFTEVAKVDSEALSVLRSAITNVNHLTSTSEAYLSALRKEAIIPLGNMSGDYFTRRNWNFSVSSNSLISESYFTRVIDNVKPDGSLEFISSGFIKLSTAPISTYLTFSGRNGQGYPTYTSYLSDTCRWDPIVYGPGNDLFVGKSWDTNSTQKCERTDGRVSGIQDISCRSVGRVAKVGPHTVTAGTFNAFNLLFTTTCISGSTTTVTESSQWLETGSKLLLGFTNLSTSSTINNPSSRPSITYTTSDVIGFKNQTAPTYKPTIARFAGNWSLNWIGSNSGDCQLKVEIAGGLSGTCDGSLNLSGSIDINGKVSATISSGARITGSITGIHFGNGNWSNGPASGTWTAVHL